MEWENYKDKGINRLWLSDNLSPDVILAGKVVITAEVKHKKLVEYLSDSENYIYTRHFWDNRFREDIEYSFDGFEMCMRSPWRNKEAKNDWCRTCKDYYRVKVYQNPRSETFRLITGNLTKKQDLNRLFHENAYAKEAFNFIKAQAAQAELGKIEINAVRKFIEKTWPDFGCFAFDGLSCVDIDIVGKYSKEEALEAATRMDNSSHQSPINAQESISNIAKNNSKVLELAKRLNKLTSK